MNESLLIILAIVLNGLLIAWVLRRWFRSLESRQVSGIRNRLRRLRPTPVASTTPLEYPVDTAQRRAVRSVQSRFTIIRRTSNTVIMAIVAVVILVPMLASVTASGISALIVITGGIIGIAARPVLENLVSGVMITFSGVFREADTVIIDGQYGTIEDITLTHTIIKVWDWRRYVIPNARLISKEFANLTLNDNYQWRHVEFWVAPHTDLGQVKELAVAAAQNSRHFADHEKPRFWVMEMGKEGIHCWLAAWANSPADAWELGNDIRTQLVLSFQQHQIQTHRFHWQGQDIERPRRRERRPDKNQRSTVRIP